MFMTTVMSKSKVAVHASPLTHANPVEGVCCVPMDFKAGIVANETMPSLPPTRLSGGLFNQIWALLGLVMQAAETGAPLSLPRWDSHLWPTSMGLERDARFKRPIALPFGALWRVDCFAAALRANGLTVLEEPPPSRRGPIGSSAIPTSSDAALKRYRRYLDARNSGTVAAHPIEAIVYRALQPAHHLAVRARRLRQAVVDRSGGEEYGCLHARVEKDMKRWWYHVAKVRPPTMSEILDAVGSVPALRQTGSDQAAAHT